MSEKRRSVTKNNIKKYREKKLKKNAPDSRSASRNSLQTSAAGPHISSSGRCDNTSPSASRERMSRIGMAGFGGGLAGRGGHERRRPRSTAALAAALKLSAAAAARLLPSAAATTTGIGRSTAATATRAPGEVSASFEDVFKRLPEEASGVSGVGVGRFLLRARLSLRGNGDAVVVVVGEEGGGARTSRASPTSSVADVDALIESRDLPPIVLS